MTNWRKITRELCQTLGSHRVVAELVGGSESGIAELKSGRTVEPRHSKGVKLIKLHERVCK